MFWFENDISMHLLFDARQTKEEERNSGKRRRIVAGSKSNEINPIESIKKLVTREKKETKLLVHSSNIISLFV